MRPADSLSERSSLPQHRHRSLLRSQSGLGVGLSGGQFDAKTDGAFPVSLTRDTTFMFLQNSLTRGETETVVRVDCGVGRPSWCISGDLEQ
jgi:hypothetical protein